MKILLSISEHQIDNYLKASHLDCNYDMTSRNHYFDALTHILNKYFSSYILEYVTAYEDQIDELLSMGEDE